MDILLIFAVGFVLGLYVATQLEKSDTLNQNKKLIDNMNKFNKHGTTKSKGKG